MAWWQMVIVGLAALGALYGFITAAFRAGSWIGSVNSDRESFKEFMNEVREKLDKIFERLPPPPVVASASPVRLTEFGQEISRNLNATGWASEKAAQLQARVTDMEPFQIHAFSKEYVGDQSATDPVLQALIAKGAYEHGVEMDSIREVFTVELRDALFRALGLEP